MLNQGRSNLSGEMKQEIEAIVQEADRLAVQRIARSLIGVRFRHQGRSREFGIDCFGLPFVVAQEMGWDYPDYHSYSRQPNWAETYRYLNAHLKRIPTGDIEIGDIGLLDESTPHGAIFVDGFPLNIVHSAAIQRKVIETRFDQAWRLKLKTAYRYNELWRN